MLHRELSLIRLHAVFSNRHFLQFIQIAYLDRDGILKAIIPNNNRFQLSELREIENSVFAVVATPTVHNDLLDLSGNALPLFFGVDVGIGVGKGKGDVLFKHADI